MRVNEYGKEIKMNVIYVIASACFCSLTHSER